MSHIPRIYLPPYNGPLNWQNEGSGQLPAAVIAYFSHSADPAVNKAPSDEQIALVIEYVRYYIEAPCWVGAGEGDDLHRLRTGAHDLRTANDLTRWINECLEIGIDPL